MVADFRHCADGGAGGADGVALFNGDGGDAFDAVHPWLVHPIENCRARRGKKSRYNAAIFGGSVERERIFRLKLLARDDDEPMQRQIKIKVLRLLCRTPRRRMTADGFGSATRRKVEQGRVMSNVMLIRLPSPSSLTSIPHRACGRLVELQISSPLRGPAG